MKERLERLARTILDRYRAKVAVRPPWKRVFDVVMLAALAFLLVVSIAGVGSAWKPSLETWGNLQAHLAVASGLILLATLVVRSHGWSVIAVAVLLLNVTAVAVRVAPVTTCPVMMAATGQQTARILTHNISWRNRDFDAIDRLFAETDADIIVLQEVRQSHALYLEKLRERYPYQVMCDAGDYCGIVILSRHPIEYRETIEDENHIALAMETAVSIDGHELVLVGAHLSRPFRGVGQANQFRSLTRVVAELPPNTVVAGDFNSAPWSTNMARYAPDAGVCASNAAQSTWPQWLGPFGIPIDHVFLKSGVQLLSVGAVNGAKSDHKALVATVGLR